MVGQFLVNRGGVWQYKRRVPADVAHLDPRGTIRRSTGKRELAEAAVVAARFNAEVEAYWQTASARGSSQPSAAAAEFERAVKLARTLGLTYRPTSELVQADLSELVDRLRVLEERQLAGKEPATSAVLGAADAPVLMLSELVATYEAHVRETLQDKSADQLRKWRNPRLRAVANLIDVVGDKAVTAITRSDAFELREWWLDRVVDEGKQTDTANKDLQHLTTMLSTLRLAWRLDADDPFAGLRLKGRKYKPRLPYEADFVRQQFLWADRIGNLNDEASAIIRMVAWTGMRPSEIATLTEARIRLTDNIPHVQIRPESRELKSEAADRDMPLVGGALETMRRFPRGFPRYRDVPDSFSATANKGLSDAKLRPTARHTVYSLRHTFKDRLIALEAPPRVQDALMGHAVGEMRYGAGPSLEQCAEWIGRVWA